MKAMILAAGLGTRLRPLTYKTPKALIEISGMTMLEIAARRLIKAGVDEIIINTSYLSDSVREFLKAKNNFGIRVEVSHEEELLDTGGGLKKAAWFFDNAKPFFLYNADIFCDMDLKSMYEHHVRNGSLATLAVKDRMSDSYFLFDDELLLRGLLSSKRKTISTGGNDAGEFKKLAFSGIHVLSPDIFSKLKETGVFSIIEPYLRLAREGEKIRGFRMDDSFWQDMGSIKKLEELKKTINNIEI